MSRLHQPPPPDDLPEHTCPAFDAAIARIEEARNANSAMRSVALEWQEQSNYWEKMADQRGEEIADLNREISRLEKIVIEFEQEASK
jgi:hypothetical protein